MKNIAINDREKTIFCKRQFDIAVVSILAKSSPVILAVIVLLTIFIGNPNIFGLTIIVAFFSFILFIFYSHFLRCAKKIEISTTAKSMKIYYFLSSKVDTFNFKDIEKILYKTDTVVKMKNGKKVIWKGGASEKPFISILKKIEEKTSEET